MKIALDPALLNAQPVPAVFDAAARAGYGAVELCNRDDFVPANGALAATPDELAAARDAARSAGVEIASVAIIQPWSSPDEDTRSRAVARWADGIRAAVDLGSRRVNSELSGDPNTPQPCRSAFLRSIETLLPTLDREDLVLSIEPHPWDFLETTAAALELFREIGSDRVRYLHCVPHTYHLGGTVTDQVRQAHGWFDHVHLADTFRPERTIVNPPGLDHRIHQHFDIGTGELDWTEVATALSAEGFDGLATVQVFGWEDRAERSFAANRAALAQLFPAAAIA